MSLTKAIEHGKERANAQHLEARQHHEMELVAGGNLEQAHNAPNVEADVEEAGTTGDERGRAG